LQVKGPRLLGMTAGIVISGYHLILWRMRAVDESDMLAHAVRKRTLDTLRMVPVSSKEPLRVLLWNTSMNPTSFMEDFLKRSTRLGEPALDNVCRLLPRFNQGDRFISGEVLAVASTERIRNLEESALEKVGVSSLQADGELDQRSWTRRGSRDDMEERQKRQEEAFHLRTHLHEKTEGVTGVEECFL
jgi:hypothetical protein